MRGRLHGFGVLGFWVLEFWGFGVLRFSGFEDLGFSDFGSCGFGVSLLSFGTIKKAVTCCEHTVDFFQLPFQNQPWSLAFDGGRKVVRLQVLYHQAEMTAAHGWRFRVSVQVSGSVVLRFSALKSLTETRARTASASCQFRTHEANVSGL